MKQNLQRNKTTSMTRITILLTSFFLLIASAGMAQTVTLKGENISVEQAIASIKQQTNYSFFYDVSLLKNTRPVSLNLQNVPLEEALTALFSNQPIDYKIESSVIVLALKKTTVSPATPKPTINDIVVKGRVINDNNEPLQGAVITLTGAALVSSADSKGQFQLRLSPDQAARGSLTITFVGYKRTTVRIGKRTDLLVEMVKDEQMLENFIITNSYAGAKRKEEVVGSIATVSKEELQVLRPIESIDKMLEGLAAGVQVEQSTELGTPVKINIRGQNALSTLNRTNVTQLTTSSQPLFVVDGVPITEQRKGDESIAFLNNEELLNPIAGLNPDDIESISVLKDAAAASIYGANASNGVIIITTKKGKAGKTRLNVGYSNGWAQSINKIKWLNGSDYHSLVKEMYTNDGRSPLDAELLAGANNINTPWFELVNRYSTFTNVDVDVSGGTDKTSFRLSGSYLKQEAIQKGNDYEKVYVRLRIDHQLANKFKMTVSMAPTITKKNALNVYASVPIIPNAPSYNADGSFYKFTTLGVPNPLAILDQNTNFHSGGSFNGNIRFEYTLKPNLSLATTFGIDGLQNKLNLFDSPLNATGESKKGFAQIFDRTSFSWISSSQVNWSPQVKKIHKFDVIAGFEARQESTNLLKGSGTGFTYYRLNELSNASSQSSASSSQQSTAASIYGQAGYNFKSKIFTTLSGRYDAASIFGTDVNATVNAAIGLGWILSKEKFFTVPDWMDMLRVRVSYGTTGNSRIGSYQARGLYGFNNTGYNGGTSSFPSSAPNPALGWEKNYKSNFGIDMGIKKRFNLTLEFYQNILDDAITPIPVPAQNGFTSVLANIGKMRNAGIDLSLNAQVFDGNFKWRSVLNVGYNKNKIIAIKNKASLFGASTEGTVLREGVSTGAIWGFEFAGVDPATGREQYIDINGNKVSVYDLDRNIATGGKYLGDRLPKAQGAFINSFSYKAISITVTMPYSFGSKILIDNANENNGRNLSNRNQSVNLLDRWQKPGDISNIPLLSASTNPLVYTSSKYVYDNTYIQLSNVSISYSLPKKYTAKLKGIGITVYGNASNIGYWYKQKSPEGRNGIKEYRFNFPQAQTFTWGTRISI